MNTWQYLYEVYGLENFISHEVAVKAAAIKPAPVAAVQAKICFLTPETAEAFQQKYAVLFDKMMQAMGLTSDMYQLMFAQKTFVTAHESLQVLFDSTQPLGWQTNPSQLVVSSLEDLLANVDAKRKTWFHLKEVSSRLQ